MRGRLEGEIDANFERNQGDVVGNKREEEIMWRSSRGDEYDPQISYRSLCTLQINPK